MIRCPACFVETDPGARFCSSCGAPIEERSATPTITSFDTGREGPVAPRAPASRPAPSMAGRLASGEAMEVARFLPGTVLGGRYRVIGLIGRGGMGEIYRADDLKLGQPVALKFLPESLAHDPAWLARFHDEVRIARQVSHPNVCRVYDIGEVDGQHYFTMEYVDGEDLASLLRRIGRLPRDKAVEIARQLCAGLAAAHERGVLHRDLKPANVMIDGRGRARLTDFGIAGLAERLGGEAARAGTPAYMAPEQLAGREATVRSDVYALGLVLYETFTGKPTFEAGTLAELMRMHETAVPTSPSKVLDGIDPVVERIILRCLEKDPKDRPASALAVAAALPGGDPLAAALAAGETPSPDMIAAAGAEGTLRPATAWVVLGALVAGIALLAWLAGRTALHRMIPFDRPPAVLVDRAQDVLRKAGLTERPEDRAFGISRNEDVLGWLEKRDRSASRFAPLGSGRLGAVGFWYRQSPRPMASTDLLGRVTPREPPSDVSGMAAVSLDEGGRLLELRVVPAQVGGKGEAGKEPDWAPLFAAAGLDPGEFAREAPAWLPPFYADVRASWKGSLPDLVGVPIRVEAAGYLGRPVYFKVIGPWVRAASMEAEPREGTRRFAQNFAVVLLLGGLAFALALARRNLRSGRGDLRGATRMALAAVGLYLAQWALGANHLASMGAEFASFVRGTGLALFVGAFVWLLYLALEPAVRRRWPGTLVSWSRLLAFRFRDPLVGRDVLVGGAIGVGLALLDPLRVIVTAWLGAPPARPLEVNLDAVVGARGFLGHLLAVPTGAMLGPMLVLFLIVGLRTLLRSQWVALVAASLLFLPTVSFGDTPAVDLAFGLLAIAIQVLVLMRLGLHALIIVAVFGILLGSYPLTTDPSSWYAGASLATMALAALLGGYGFVTSTRGPRGAAPDGLLD